MKSPYRMRSAAALHALHSGPNMTPMVDVVMVILIFFMASAAVMGPEWLLRTALPGPGARGAATPTKITAVVVELRKTPEGFRASVTVGMGESRASSEHETSAVRDVLGRLVALHGADGLAVAIRAGDDVAYEEVVSVHEACAGFGVTRVGVPGGAGRAR